MNLRTGFVVGSTLMAFACSSDGVTGAAPQPGDTGLPTAGWRPAAITIVGYSPEMSTPAAINVNDTARVSFTIYLEGCIRETRNEIAVVGLDADIRPQQLNYQPESPDPCTSGGSVSRPALPG